MEHIFLIILFMPFTANGMETGDTKKQIFNTYEFCNDCFIKQQNGWVQQPSTETALPNCEIKLITKSLNKQFILYKSLCNDKDHSHHHNMYYLTDSNGTIIDRWRDYYDWQQHTAINNNGTYVITKRDQDYWLRKITYTKEGISHTHAVTPIQRTLFPCFFLNQNTLIAYSKETSDGRRQQALYAWDINESFGKQKCYAKKNIYAPVEIIPKAAYRIWNEDHLLVADCKAHTQEIELSLWNVRTQSDIISAKFNITGQELTLPLIACISTGKRYIACSVGKKLFLCDLWHPELKYIRSSSGTINGFHFVKQNKELNEDDCIKYSIIDDKQERIWKFKTLNTQATQ